VPGKHASPQVKRSYTGPLASAAVIAALLVGGTVGAVKLTQERTASVTPAATATASPAPARAGSALDRASRGDARIESTPTPAPAATAGPTASPTPSPTVSRKPSPKPTPSATKKAPPAAKVVESGSCGASYYDEPQGTANGETFDPEALTAAHKEWDFDTRVRVTNPDNGKSVVVRINDRGPYIDGRCIDLSRAAFRAIADLDLGHIDVRYEVLDG
jgi:rare lipoprotein A